MVGQFTDWKYWSNTVTHIIIELITPIRYLQKYCNIINNDILVTVAKISKIKIMIVNNNIDKSTF